MMQKQFLLALFPLVLFWAIEEFWGLKAALIAGCIAAVVEIVWEYRKQKKVSFMTWASNGLVLGLGTVSYFMDSGVAFKLQPMVLQFGMAAMMLGMRFRGGDPFMIRTLRENPMAAGNEAQRQMMTQLLEKPEFTARLTRMDSSMIGFMLVHGLAVGWAAIWGSTRLWILLKGVLFYVLLLLVLAPQMKFMYKPVRGNNK